MILSKEEVLSFYLKNKNFTKTRLIKKHIKTFNFIEDNFSKGTTFSEKMYAYIHDIKTIPMCNLCKIVPVKFSKNFRKGYSKYCGYSCASKCYDVKLKKEKTIFKNHGIFHNFKGIFGDRKCDQTKIDKYGSINYRNDEKRKQTLLTRYGVDNPFKLKQFHNKSKETKLKKYGDEKYCNSAKIREEILKRYSTSFDWNRSSSYKEYLLPSGKIVKIQGYEPFALDFLLKIYDESEIIFDKTKIPKMEYFYENKLHYYFPDFYIPKYNLIYEVKSNWTLNKHKTVYELKKQATIDSGFQFKTLVFNQKGFLINEI
jgi:hypothetical protein